MSLKKEDEINKIQFTLPNVDNVDIRKLSPIYNQEIKAPEFIQTSKRGRDIFGRLFFNTGSLYLTGFSAGCSYGLIEGWRAAVNPNFRIRLNSILNAMSKRGSKLGNSLGVIAFIHTASVGVADAITLDNYVGNTVATPVAAGFVTGFMYGIPRGSRAGALGGAIGIALSCTVWYGGSYVYNVVLGRGGRF
mmetsp:Transcript_10193/g.9130  ORF Transcript_10193/g.9130 Transcript_10193/m.9130 type:complete len:191 (+) Transcript_10193:19-591(+)